MPTLKTYLALDRRIWLLAAARAINTAGLSLVMAFMALYLVTQRGLSGTTTGFIYLGANVGRQGRRFEGLIGHVLSSRCALRILAKRASGCNHSEG